MGNIVKARIEEGAKVNENLSASTTGVQNVNIKAENNIQQMLNTSGIVGLKLLGASADKGFGGALLAVNYTNDVEAIIEKNTTLNADALSVVAKNIQRNISIAASGANTKELGISGSFHF